MSVLGGGWGGVCFVFFFSFNLVQKEILEIYIRKVSVQFTLHVVCVIWIKTKVDGNMGSK